MSVYKQAKSKKWWYKFNWNGETIRESTKQTNKRVAEQMEAAHRTALAKGEVGIRERKVVPTLKEFADRDFLPFVRSTFAAKPKTLAFYENGVGRLLDFDPLARARLDGITNEVVEYVTKRQEAKGKRGRPLQVRSLNCELQVLRRMFHLAEEWGKVEKALPTVKMLPGERHRERVLTPEEEAVYFAAAKSEKMERHSDPRLLHDVASVLLDCALRPEECFRLRPENVRDRRIEIQYGKTDNARRRIPMTPRVAAILDMRLTKSAGNEWVFPAATKSGHIEPSSLKKQHLNAITEATRMLQKETGSGDAKFEGFELYTLRHTCLTRWAPHMDPWTLAYLAGHRDMNITKRYIHPQEQTIRAAMDRAQAGASGHTSGHTDEKTDLASLRYQPQQSEAMRFELWAVAGSNRGPSACKADALTN
jgi:integrase